MPIANGSYEKLTADEIQAALESELQTEFGNDIDLTQSSVFTTLSNVLATVLSDNQEQSLQDVYQSAFLDTATGNDLDRVVSIIGIKRRSAIHATGVEQFQANGPVTQDHTIQSGTTVQTRGTDPVEFETTESVDLELVDSFEGANPISNYSGDTGSASVVADSNAPEGDNVLQLDATAGAVIYNDDIEFQQGSTLHAHVRPNASTIPTVVFGLDTLNPGDYYQIAVDEGLDEVRLERVSSGSVAATIDTLSSAGLTTGSFHELEWDWSITDNIGITVYAPDGSELGTLGGVDGNYLTGAPGFKSGDANAAKEFDFYTTSAVSANIRASSGGTVGNVGANSITATVSPPSGVDTVTNLYPTGTTQYKDTNDQEFVIGQERETDDELRDRANQAVTGGGDATHDAIVSELVNDTPGVTSVTVFQNKTDNDNTGTGGLPPHSFEAVVFGGDDEEVAETIFEKKAVTARDYGGANGTAVSVTVTAASNGQTRTIQFSRPTKVDVDMTLDLVIDDSYIGDDNLRDEIVSYIGGTLSNGSETIGLGVGEDVRIDAIADIVVGSETGVLGLDQSVDGTPIETTPAKTTVNGLEVIDVGGNEVAQSDATDASITLNTREQ